MPTIRQTSFAGGELSPLLWGRTDLPMHAHGARGLLNWMVNQQGNALTRPGTRLLWQARETDVVLVPFVYSDSESFVVEMGAGYARIYSSQGGAFVAELTTPYSVANLAELQWAQAGGSLVFAHSAHAPQELLSPSAFTSSAWAWRAYSFAPAGDTLGAATLTPVFQTSGGALRGTPLPWDETAGVLFVKDDAHPPREWRWMVSTLLRHNVTGDELETVAIPVTSYLSATNTIEPMPDSGLVVLYADAPVKLRHTFSSPSTAHANWTPFGVVFYRGRGNVFGLVGTTSDARDFIDVGDEPDYTTQPLRGDAPFSADAGWPSCVAYFQGRLCFGRGFTLRTSATDAWSDFDELRGPHVREDMPLELTVAARRRESFRSLATSHRLLGLTESSAWSIGGSGGPFGASSIETRLEDETGATKLQPLVVDGAVLYVRAKGRGVRALQVADGGQFQVSDVTWHAAHLFRDYYDEVVSWAWQRDPWATIWAARRDGSLLSCVRTGAGLWAWARHTTGPDDAVLSVCAVPDARADAVFLAVRRVGGTFIERLTTRDRVTETAGVARLEELGDGSYAVDSHVVVDKGSGDYESAPFSVSGLAHLEGREVWAVAPGNPPQGPFVVSGGSVTVGPFSDGNFEFGGLMALRLVVGLPYTCDVELLDAAPGTLQQKTVVRVGFEVDSAIGLQVGEDFGHLVEWRQRTVEDSYEYPSAASALVVANVAGAWRRTGRAVLRQAKPLPVTLLGVTREVASGG